MRAVISSRSFRSSINRSVVLLRTACGSTQSLGSDGSGSSAGCFFWKGVSANVVAFKRAFSTALRARSSTFWCCDVFFSSDAFLGCGRARGATGWLREEVEGKLSADGSLRRSTFPEEKAAASVPPGGRVVLVLSACKSFLSRSRNCSMCLAYCNMGRKYFCSLQRESTPPCVHRNWAPQYPIVCPGK